MKFKGLLIFTAIALVVMGYFMVSGGPAPAVQIYVVDSGPVESTVSNTRSGTIEACKRSHLSPTIGGQISQIHVAEGDQVAAGQLLMELWNRDAKAAVERAEAALQAHRLQQHSACIAAASDEREAKRLAALAKKELAAAEIVDRATSRADASEANCLAAKSVEKEFEAQYKLQRARLSQTFIRAPFAGIVAEITGEVGEYTTPSPPGVPTPPAIDLLTSDCFYLSAPIDEVDAARLTVGQDARVSLDAYRNRSFAGTLRRISPYVEDRAKQARTVEVEVDFSSEAVQLLAGYSADVEVVLVKRDRVLRVPTEAIMENHRVWVVDDNSAIAVRAIETGIGNWKFTEVSEGLSEGEQVVTSLGISGLGPGEKVSVSADD